MQTPGKIVATFFISVDGVVESPDKWHFPYFSEEMGAAITRGTDRCGAYLMGRGLYEEWIGHWPGQTDSFGAFINNTEKYVLSNSLENPTWDRTTVISGDDDAVAARVRSLKEQTDGDIGMFGSATTVRWLMAHDLLDELDLLVHPIVVGWGAKLFDGVSTHPLTLVEQETLSAGALHLRYSLS